MARPILPEDRRKRNVSITLSPRQIEQLKRLTDIYKTSYSELIGLLINAEYVREVDRQKEDWD